MFAPFVLNFSSISLQSLGVGQWEARYSQRPELLKQHQSNKKTRATEEETERKQGSK